MNGKWAVMQPSPALRTCPATVPTNGASCNVCTTHPTCYYPCTGGAGAPTEASCSNGTWQVSSGLGACPVCEPSCSGSSICCVEPVNDGGTEPMCVEPLDNGACPELQ